MLILLRHGRTRANAKGLLQGRIDLELDDVGHAQATAAAEWLGPVDRVISSPLRRARQTAAALGPDVEIDDRFIELSYGEWEGLPVGDVPSATWQTWRNDVAFEPPGGESLLTLGNRVRGALDALIDEAATSDIVVVSHMSPIKAAVAWALGQGDELTWRTTLGQAAICRIGVRNGAPQLVEFNQTGHLRGIS